MKKSRLLIVLAGLAVVASGCGYSTGGEDSTVTVIEATPTPTPEPTPEVTPTPEATPTPAVEMAQTASGVNIIKQSGTYYAVEGVNIRSDCSTDADIITGTLGKALGGASGGYTSGRKEIIDLLRQRSRPYLFSNSLAPAIAGASIEMFNMLEESTELRDHLEEVTAYYRKQLVENGFDIIEGTHPCVPVMLYDERLAGEYAKKMMEKGRTLAFQVSEELFQKVKEYLAWYKFEE